MRPYFILVKKACRLETNGRTNHSGNATNSSRILRLFFHQETLLCFRANIATYTDIITTHLSRSSYNLKYIYKIIIKMARQLIDKIRQRDRATKQGGDHNGQDQENNNDEEENHGQDENHNNNCDINNCNQTLRRTSHHPFMQGMLLRQSLILANKNCDHDGNDDDPNHDDVDDHDDDEEFEIEEDDEEYDDEEQDDLDEENLVNVDGELYEHDDGVNGYCTDRSSTTSSSCTPDGNHHHHHHHHHHNLNHNHNHNHNLNSDPSSHHSHHQHKANNPVSSSDNQLARTQAHYLEMASQFTIPEGQTRVCDCCYCEVFGHGASPMAPTSRNYAEMRERLRQRLSKKREECNKTCPDDSSNDKGGGGAGVTTNDVSSANNNNHLNNSNFNTKTSSNHVADQRNLDELLEFINGRSTKDNDKSLSKKKQDHKNNNNNTNKINSKNKSNNNCNHNNKTSASVSTKNISSPMINNSSKSQTNNASSKNNASKSCQSNGSCNVGGKLKPQNVTTKSRNNVKKTLDEANNINNSITKRKNNNTNNNNNTTNINPSSKKMPTPKPDTLSPTPVTQFRANRPSSKQKNNPSNIMSKDTNHKASQPKRTGQKMKPKCCDDCDCSPPGPDDVFLPKRDIDLNNDELDDLERELEAFKRFCFDSLPLVKKERVRLNLNSDFLKRPIQK